VAYLTLYGLIYRQTVGYIFERSEQLIQFPPVPINFDYDRLKRAENAIATLREQVVMSREEFFRLIPGLAFDEREWFASLVEQDGDDVALSAFGQLFVHQLSQQQASIWLSSSAANTLAAFDGTAKRSIHSLLERLRDPLWRLSHLHAFSGTDLTVWKVPHTAYRFAGYESKDGVIVAEIYVDHNQYERELPGKRLTHYFAADFQFWVLDSAEEVLPTGDDAITDDMQKEIDDLKRENAELLKMLELTQAL